MMMTMGIVISLMMLAGIISIGIRLAWGAAKFMFGLGLFWICPVLFVIIVLFGGFHSMWLPILLAGLLFGRGFCRI